ncbi:hypothetical protein [Nocardioides ferulae]|uniref:hypothetical protein n=1 Tax=Nocardioides ferulae TaxID=2340821 RepID=UPI000F889C83|nr:hypothetical protein [Nocardioides ferulae]
MRTRSRLPALTAVLTGVLVAAVVVALALVPGWMRAEGDEQTGGAAAPTVTPAAPTDSAEPAPDRQRSKVRRPPGSGSVPLPGGGRLIGTWEDGRVLGEVVVLGRVGEHEQVLYAARPGSETAGAGADYVATGVRVGDRILRTILALRPEAEEARDGMDLYGGNVLGERGPDGLVAGGDYLLLGAVPGEARVRIEAPGEADRAVTGASGTVLPGYTVFHDSGDWRAAWDQVQLAPLVVTTDAGHRVLVRELSWTG